MELIAIRSSPENIPKINTEGSSSRWNERSLDSDSFHMKQ